MAIESKTWNIGDTYYRACGQMNGMNWDLGDYAEECLTEAEAEENAAEWFGWLSKSEQRFAKIYVLRFRVLGLDDDGTIGASETY